MNDPVENLALRLLAKNNLHPPVDLASLIVGRCDLSYISIPIDGVDGCIYNLKHPTKKAKIFININSPKKRQRFTLAHEIGHLFIPWHYGNIIDHLAPKQPEEFIDQLYHYIEIEKEANRFASELLMPTPWVKQQLASNKNLMEVHNNISTMANVSSFAAALKIIASAKAPVAFAELDKTGIAVNTGSSHLLGLRQPAVGEHVNEIEANYKAANSFYS